MTRCLTPPPSTPQLPRQITLPFWPMKTPRFPPLPSCVSFPLPLLTLSLSLSLDVRCAPLLLSTLLLFSHLLWSVGVTQHVTIAVPPPPPRLSPRPPTPPSPHRLPLSPPPSPSSRLGIPVALVALCDSAARLRRDMCRREPLFTPHPPLPLFPRWTCCTARGDGD